MDLVDLCEKFKQSGHWLGLDGNFSSVLFFRECLEDLQKGNDPVVEVYSGKYLLLSSLMRVRIDQYRVDAGEEQELGNILDKLQEIISMDSVKLCEEYSLEQLQEMRQVLIDQSKQLWLEDRLGLTDPGEIERQRYEYIKWLSSCDNPIQYMDCEQALDVWWTLGQNERVYRQNLIEEAMLISDGTWANRLDNSDYATIEIKRCQFFKWLAVCDNPAQYANYNRAIDAWLLEDI